MNRPSSQEIQNIYAGIELRPDLPVACETWNSQGEVFGEEHNLSLGMVGHHWFFRKP